MLIHSLRKNDPFVFGLRPYRCSGLRETGISESADSKTEEIRIRIQFPVKRRAALAAEIKAQCPAGISRALVLRGGTRHAYLRSWKVGADSKDRPGPALTLQAVAHDYSGRLTTALSHESPAAAFRNSEHRTPRECL